MRGRQSFLAILGWQMKKLVAGLLLSLGIVSMVQAEGNAQNGEALSVPCSACHGTDGNSLSDAFPKLAGQHESYLLKQLQEMKAGDRANPTMIGQLDNLSEQDLEDLAAYFASQAPSIGTANPDLVAAGEKVYRAGNLETGVVACTACHSPTGRGNGPAKFPALGGQHAAYIVTQLKAFRAGERTNDGESQMMRTITFRMNDKEIEAVASYISGLH